jgi:TRAP-type C4-dicarboxylate transport system permease small subunit
LATTAALLRTLRRALDALCGLVAATALFGIMWLTLVDVSGRKLLSASVPGSLELTELMMVAVIFGALPLVSLHGEHVVFDSLDPLLEARLRRWQGAFVDALCAALLAGMAWLMWTKAGQMAEYGDTTAQLKIPQSPFVVAMSVLCGVTALVHLLLMFDPVSHHHVGVQDGPAKDVAAP